MTTAADEPLVPERDLCWQAAPGCGCRCIRAKGHPPVGVPSRCLHDNTMPCGPVVPSFGTAELSGYVNDMDGWKYCTVKSGDVRITLYSDGRIELPEVRHRDIADVMACLGFALKYGDRLW